ncbi:MAG: DUF899 domain-containing protein [Pseudonocardia sp.]|nr:DUF899 domain-containing protein [Pseudonocardia sp.]
MTLPDVVSREQWQAARVALLVREKELTRARDALNADRRRLPMVEITKDYELSGPDGPLSLLDAFDGHRQLMVGHFMFDPAWERGCGSCTAGADEYSDGLAAHLHARDTHLVHVSRAPIEKIEKYKAEKGWSFPWYSSHGSDFNYDFHVTLDPAVAPVEYNYRSPAESGFTIPEGESMEVPGLSCFLRDGDRVFHTYSQYARGAESTGGSYYFLDLTALGRQEDWEEPKGRAKHGAVPDFS